jgi:hypothetical protein
MIFSFSFAQEEENKSHKGHYNTSKFKQMNDLLPQPNAYRTASGAPGHAYYQNKADYDMEIELIDSDKPRLIGEETITYYNNSPDNLDYLWVQLDQNKREPNAYTDQIKDDGENMMLRPGKFISQYTNEGYKGGYHLTAVTLTDGTKLDYSINHTMMRINLPQPLLAGEQFSFKIAWWYDINNFAEDWGRSGFETFKEDGNNLYIIAQFYPRMAVYDDVNGWQNLQFIQTGEFTLPFGDFRVAITAPADHILDGTGVLKNMKKVFSRKQYKRFLRAQKTFDKPVMIVTPEEAEANESSKSWKQKTWQFEAKNVRDFAFASSRKFIYDMMAVKLDTKTVMAVSMYPKEAQPLWEEFSTRTVANTLKVYSKHLFDYPYHKAISVNAFRQGMEYPMICWNYGRPDKNGKISNRTKTGMIKVITHEVGHNWFPMIVNSDERQWMWMDEGLNTFTELLAEQAFEKEIGFPLDSRGLPKQVVPFMKGDQSKMHPIMVNSDLMYNRSMTAYSKPAAGLYMLREVIMGHEAFDYAFKTYANRWKFKHPEPADFFRTMEDASAVDLDWFWRGWFFTTRVNDMAIKKVEKFYVTDKPTVRIKRMAMMYGMKVEDFPPFVSLVTEDSQDFTPDMKSDESFIYRATKLKDFLNENFSRREIANLKTPKYFYRVVFEQKGELVMPIVVKITYKDGSTEQKIFPAKVWRFNNAEVSKMIPSTKEITKIEVDPENLTADIDMTNNTWPKLKASSEFDEIKKTIKK